MKTLLKLRRLTRKRAYLSHKPEWLLIDTLMAIFAIGLVQFIVYSIIFGIK